MKEKAGDRIRNLIRECNPVYIARNYIRNRKLRKMIRKEEDRQEYMPSGMMRLNRILGSGSWITTSTVFLVLIQFLLFNWAFNTLSNISAWFRHVSEPGRNIGFKNIFLDISLIRRAGSAGLVIYLLFIGYLVVFAVMHVVRMRMSFGNLINKGVAGESRWATKEEIRRQYPSVKEVEEPVPYKGGTIVAHFGGRIYFDDSTVNNLILGMTRSGKGECFVIPSIDIYSRVEDPQNRPSLIYTDPKKEIAKMSKKTLEKRGYEHHILDFDDPEKSMGYNPLSLVVSAYKEGNKDLAEQLANTFSYTLYHSKPATDDYWPDQATAMCNALIMAMVQDCIEADKEFNRKRKAAYDRKRENFDQLSEDAKQAGRDNYSACLKEFNEKQMHPDEFFLVEDLVFLPPEVAYYTSVKNEDCINIYSLKNIVTELQMEPAKGGNSDLTALDEFFMRRPEGDIAKLEYASVGGAPQQTKACIYSSFMKGINIISQSNMARLTAENSIDLLDVGYGDKPIAISVVIPDDDKSRWFMATIFISQLYFVLSRETRKNPKGKTDRPVRFILDEFGNLPAFEAMDSYLSVCLGKNISFDLYIQDYQQLEARYQKNSSTIKNNCGNKIWILSNDNNGAKEFSEMLGMTKRIQVERSGTAFSSNKTFTERPVEEPLMKPFQLMHLLPGEIVVNRSSKREDLQHAPSVSYPIFNSYEMGMAFKYRYQYLHEYFPNADEVRLEDITTDSREHINYLERVWDYEGTQELKNTDTQKVLGECKNYAAIKEDLRRMYGVNYIDQTGFDDKYPVETLIWNLKNDTIHDPALVEMLISRLNE